MKIAAIKALFAILFLAAGVALLGWGVGRKTTCGVLLIFYAAILDAEISIQQKRAEIEQTVIATLIHEINKGLRDRRNQNQNIYMQ